MEVVCALNSQHDFPIGGDGAEKAGVRVQGGEEHAIQDPREEERVRGKVVREGGAPAQARPVSQTATTLAGHLLLRAALIGRMLF